MFEEEKSLDSTEKVLREKIKDKGKFLKRAESAYDELSDAEKIFINYYLNDPNMSFGSAVIKSGLADSNEDAIKIGLAMKRNPRIIRALEEIEELGGVTPLLIKKSIWQLSKDTEDENVKLRSLQTLAEYMGMKVHYVKSETASVQLNVEEIKDRINNKLPNVIEESKQIIAKLQNKNDEPDYLT